MIDDGQEHERIKFDRDTLDVLRGADDVRDRLLIELATGVPAISVLAYATKVRVKEDFKIAEKVLRKRLEKNEPAYSVSRLRDIVGLRIVTLYRLDALRIIPLLLDKIQKAPNDPTSLFVRDELEEVIIYGSNSAGDPHTLTNRLLAMFEGRKLRCKPSVRDTVTNYSSIHMVTWCRGRYNDGYRRIPVEIQVRTALEDVWGEIEHGLKYKRRLGQKIEAEDSRFQTSEAHLNVMKSLIDGVAQYADQIKIQFDQIDDQRLRGSSSRLAEDGLTRLAEISDLPGSIVELAGEAIDAAQKAVVEGRSKLSKTDHVKVLTRSLNSLNAVYQTAGRFPGLLEEQVKELRYVLGMERALCMFEIGNASDDGNMLTESERIYARLEQIHPGNLLIIYRRAKALDALNDRETAISKLEELISRLSDNNDLLPADHWLRSSAPRLLGVFIWERGYNIARSAGASSDPDRLADMCGAFLRAFQVTLPVLEAQPLSEEDSAKTANNLYWYALDYLEAGCDIEPLRNAGFSQDREELWLRTIGADAPAAIVDARHANTASRAHYRAGRHDLAKAAATRTLELLHLEGVRPESANAHEADMLRAAQSILDGQPCARW